MNNRKTQERSKSIVMLGLFCAIMLLMSWTPLGYLNIGPLAITLNMIPVAIAAIVLGPKGGGIIGGVFGMTSFFQCIGIGGVSGLGAVCFGIDPFFTFIQRFVPRVMVGILAGLAYRRLVLWTGRKGIACAVTGFLAAFLNTVLFMGLLLLLFGNTPELQEMIAGRNLIVFVCSFVGVNAVFEMLASTVITSAVGAALVRSRAGNGTTNKEVQ